MPTAEPNRHAILIAGMHRSGTSALARVINLHGIPVGRDLLPPQTDNALGYWEDESIVSLNDEALAQVDRNWRDPRPLPADEKRSPWFREWQPRAAQLLDAIAGDASTVAIKDPRISRLLTEWHAACRISKRQPLVLICVRNPLDVAASLHARAGIATATSLALWLEYTLAAEYASRDLPRAFVRYDDLLRDWRTTLRRAAAALDFAWPAATVDAAAKIDGFLDRDLRHFNADAATSRGDADPLQQLAERVRGLAQREAAGDVVGGDAWDLARHEFAELVRQLPAADDLPPSPPALPQRSKSGLWTPIALTTPVVEARLYFRNDGVRADENQYVIAVSRLRDYPMRAHFRLPAGATPDFIRFDPANMPGMFRIHAISINGAPFSAGDLRVSAVNRRRLPSLHGELSRFYSDDDDPYFELDVRDRLPSAEVSTVDISFDCDTAIEAMERYFLRAQQRSDARLAALSAALDEARARHHAIEQTLTSLSMQAARERQQNIAASRFALLADSGHGALPQLPNAKSRRIRRWRSNRLGISAARGVRLRARNRDGSVWWSSVSDDPQFVLALPGAQPLAAGNYVLAMDFASLDDSYEPPILYVDYGQGPREADAIALKVSWHTLKQRLVVRFTQPVRSLRLDPRNGAGDYVFSRPTLRRIGSLESLLRIGVPAIQRYRALGASWRDVWRESHATLRQSGLSGAAATLEHNASLAAACGSADYEAWIAQFDTLSGPDREALAATVAAMRDPPLISIVMPVYNTPERWLRRCIESVLAQLYPHWELCIADDASTARHVRKVLAEYAARDPRIKFVRRRHNGHISAASNSALELATGDWIALLDHDDELPERALYDVAQTIAAHPDAKLIYSDEDKISEDGRRFDPYFKPDWNPELFLGQNMISHLGVYSSALVRQAGGFREGMEGSQDYDLALRAIELIDGSQIRHIPRVLYHWRSIAGSTAQATGNKQYASDAGLRAAREHASRTGARVAIDVLAGGVYRKVSYNLPAEPPPVTVIIPTRNGLDLTKQCVETLFKITDYPQINVLIVDNQSDDPQVLRWFDSLAATEPRVRVLRYAQPFNFSAINNFAVRAATTPMVALLNNDIEITEPGWLGEMIACAVEPDVGAVGAKLFYPDGRIQHAGVLLGHGGVAAHPYTTMPHNHNGQMGRARLLQEVSAVTAACLVVARDKYLAVGGMNEDLPVAFNDVDFCLRLRRAGYRNIWTPFARLTHHESASRGAEDTPEKQRRFEREVAYMRRTWGDMLVCDPFYNPNLTLAAQPYALAATPRTGSAREAPQTP